MHLKESESVNQSITSRLLTELVESTENGADEPDFSWLEMYDKEIQEKIRSRIAELIRIRCEIVHAAKVNPDVHVEEEWTVERAVSLIAHGVETGVLDHQQSEDCFNSLFGENIISSDRSGSNFISEPLDIPLSD